MRIRTIKPEFWRSDDITALSREDRLLFVGLWSYVDDNGVGIDDYRTIGADLFALEEDQKDVREFVREGLATLSRALLIARYEVDGKCYLHIRTWKKHQRVDRPNKARYPEPPADWKPPTSGNGKDSRGSRDTFATVSPSGTEEQGNRGTGEVTTFPAADASRSGVDAQFDEFWAAYPRKIDKQDARKAWRSALKKKANPDHLIEAARAYAQQRAHEDPAKTKYPATWLNKGSYDNEPEQSALRLVSNGTSARVPTTSQRVQAALAYLEPEEH